MAMGKLKKHNQQPLFIAAATENLAAVADDARVEGKLHEDLMSKGDRGKRLMRKRGELIERSFAHGYETGGMRRTHLRHHDNIAKRLLVHMGGFNLSLVMRKLTGIGKPRGLQGLFLSTFGLFGVLWSVLATFVRELRLSRRDVHELVCPHAAA